MSDTEEELTKAVNEDFGQNEAQTPAVTPPVEPPKDDAAQAEVDDKKDDKPATEPEKPAEAVPPETTPVPNPDDKKPDEDNRPPETAETPPPEAPTPLTKDDVKEVVTSLINDERSSSKELEAATQDVLGAYYPDGLSNILVDEKTGKELRTPQDVVEASGDTMSIEEAASWLMNEQYKLDKQVSDIKSQATEIAETTLNFKRDSVLVLQKYEPLFKAYPQLQQKVFDNLMKQVKVDKDKNVILSAPDVMEHYDFYLEPYQQAFEFSTKQSATNPTEKPAESEPPKPSTDDRLDETGDGGATPTDDPTDFAQQVTKELAKGI